MGGLISDKNCRCYRSELVIIRDILRGIYDSSREGVRKTHLMYIANLNSKQLEKYLNKLLECNSLSKLPDGRLCITKKGVVILTLMSKLLDMLGSIETRSSTNLKEHTFKLLERLGFKIVSPVYKWGSSGIRHYFDGVVKFEDKEVLIGFSSENSEDLLINFAVFLVSVIDCGGRGILVTSKKNNVNIDVEELNSKVSIVEIDLESPSDVKYLLASEILRFMRGQ